MSRFLLVFTFLLCCGVTANAQLQLSDSLLKALPDTLRPKNKQAVTDQEIIDMVLSTSSAFVYRFVNEFKTMNQHLKKQIGQLKTNEDKILYAQAIAGFYTQTTNRAPEMYWYKKVIEYGEAQTANHSILCNAYINVALDYATKNQQKVAVDLLHKATTIATADKDSATLRDTYYTYILIYRKLQLYRQAIDYANRYLTGLPARDKWATNYIEVTMTKANLYIWLYQSEKRQVHADSAKALLTVVMAATKKDAKYWYRTCYDHLGYLYYFMGDYAQALHYYDLSVLPQYTQEGSYQAMYLYKNQLFRSLSQLQLGKENGLTTALFVSIPASDYASREELNKVLSEYYAQHGNYQKGLAYYRTYRAYSDSIDVLGQRGKVFEAEQKYSVAQKEAAIAVLENKNLQAQATRNTILVTVFIGLLFLYLYNKRQQARRLAERQKLTDELNTMEQEMELQRLRQQAETEAAIVGQRKEISQNMHDEVSSSLVALRYHVADMKKAAPHESTRHLLDSIEKELNALYLQTRDLLYRMTNTNPQKNYNVFDLLEKLAQRFNANSGLQIKVQADTNLHYLLNAQQNAELYRVIKEAVANSMKHSGANRVDISLSKKERTLVFTIRDNGQGMLADAGRGLGMTTMKQRLESLNGSLSVEPSANGMSISGSFPIG